MNKRDVVVIGGGFDRHMRMLALSLALHAEASREARMNYQTEDAAEPERKPKNKGPQKRGKWWDQ